MTQAANRVSNPNIDAVDILLDAAGKHTGARTHSADADQARDMRRGGLTGRRGGLTRRGSIIAERLKREELERLMPL